MISVTGNSRSLCKMTRISGIKVSPQVTCKQIFGSLRHKSHTAQPPEGHSPPQSFPLRNRSRLHSESPGSQEPPHIHRVPANGKGVSLRHRSNGLRRNTYLLQESKYLPQMLVVHHNGHQGRRCSATRRFRI